MLASLNKVVSSVSAALDFNQATLSGCIDIIVVQQPDGSYRTTPFHVRFGKFRVMKTKEKMVQIEVNNQLAIFEMKLGEAGEGYFEQEVIRKNKVETDKDKALNKQQVEQDNKEETQTECESYNNTPQKKPNGSPSITADQKSNFNISSQAPQEGSEKKKKNFFSKLFKKPAKEEEEILDSNTLTESQNLQRLLDIRDSVTPSVSRRITNQFGDYNDDDILDSYSVMDSKPNGEKTIEESQKKRKEDREQEMEIEISLCGALILSLKPNEANNLFIKHKVTFEVFESNPDAFFSNPNLIIKLNGVIQDHTDSCSILDSLLTTNLAKSTQIRQTRISNVSYIGHKRLASPSLRELKEEDGDRMRAFTVQPKTRRNKLIDNNDKGRNLGKIKVKRTLRPTSDMIKSLNLRPGLNNIIYSVKSGVQGSQTISGSIYLWPNDAKIIVSDVDGTITKSDVLGQIMPFIGRDWSQPGIAPLYNNLRKHGYYILYLTSRAIGQAKMTKDFIYSIHQDGKMMPQGPVILSPDRSISSLKREVLFKRPEIFKVATLKDIKKLFPRGHSPFHAGFGNRITDAIAYRSVGVPLDRIYTVNPKGTISQHDNEQVSSYSKIHLKVKELFPTLSKKVEEAIHKHPKSDQSEIHVEKTVDALGLKN